MLISNAHFEKFIWLLQKKKKKVEKLETEIREDTVAGLIKV